VSASASASTASASATAAAAASTQQAVPSGTPVVQAAATSYAPTSVGVSNTIDTAPRFVVLTWSADVAWRDQLAGFRVTLYEEVISPRSFRMVSGWDRRVVSVVPGSQPDTLVSAEVGQPTYKVAYRLVVSVPNPTAGSRVKMALATVLKDGSVSATVMAVSD